MGQPLDGYIRVSKVGARTEGEGFISPQVQEGAIRAWAESRGLDVTIHPPELNRSGGTMDRPIFNQIMDRIRRGESAGVVVYKVDRFARSLLGALTTLSEIGEHGAAFASCSEQVDYISPQGRAFLQMQFVFAELFRNQIRESWDTTTGIAVLEKGIHVSHSVPYGYRRDPATRRYVAHDEEADVVRELFKRRAGRQGWRALLRWLDEEHPLPDGRSWGQSRVQRMIASRAYLGEAHYGAKSNPDAHPPLVTRELHAAANAARGISLGAPGSNPFLLTGLVRCASCRYLMQKNVARRKAPFDYYRCIGKHVPGNCADVQRTRREPVEEYVVDLLRQHLAEYRVVGRASTADIAAARATLEDAQAELNAFAMDLTARRRLGATYHVALEARAHAVEEAQRALTDAAAPNGGAAAGTAVLEGWDDWTLEQQRYVLAQSVDTVFLRGPRDAPIEERVFVCWAGEAPDDLPRRGSAAECVRPFAWPHDAPVEPRVALVQDVGDGAQRRLAS